MSRTYGYLGSAVKCRKYRMIYRLVSVPLKEALLVKLKLIRTRSSVMSNIRNSVIICGCRK
ncbi:hypothetical protein BPOR_1036g00020 [Botrytis porri]|uniref:Uncharacterized protein n=1 Tax=Botrytis porri TaxID=87229 RepID=A0A4Z1K7V4_9HELO|nr:hypothetical protein BPOR_1036g00020 [Botrytis porri]